MNKNYLCIIFDAIKFLRHALTSQIKKNQQKITTEQIKTATQSKLITFKTRESQNKALKMKNRKSKRLNHFDRTDNFKFEMSYN
jgi:serine/threonine protein phosphatase PrpC